MLPHRNQNLISMICLYFRVALFYWYSTMMWSPKWIFYVRRDCVYGVCVYVWDMTNEAPSILLLSSINGKNVEIDMEFHYIYTSKWIRFLTSNSDSPLFFNVCHMHSYKMKIEDTRKKNSVCICKEKTLSSLWFNV